MDKKDFKDKISMLSKRVEDLSPTLQTEEATKNALIMPFFQALGFDVFNPMEFIPEYTADIGIKKGERVDYAIQIDGELRVLVEAKTVTEDLTAHASQLFRYFGTTSAKFGILTNGRVYKFYTDLDEPNKMDATPFLNIDLSNVREAQVTELFRFTKDNFDVDKISSTAENLKYVSAFKEYLTKQMTTPSDDLVRLALNDFYEGQKNQKVIEKFSPIFARGFAQLITEQVNDKLSNALNAPVSVREQETPVTETTPEPEVADDGIVTTPAELEAFTTAKIILAPVLGESRVFYRDNKNYFNVLIDDNIRKWVFRVFFNKSRSWIVLNDESNTSLDFSSPIDIINYGDQIKAVAEQYK